jgi:hypothetical protein
LASIEKAREAAGSIPQRWLTWRVDRDWSDLKAILEGAAKLDTFLTVFREATDRTAALLSNLARLSEDMSSEERRTAESFIARVLALAEVETSVASDLIAAGTRIEEAGSANGDEQKLALGHLVHAIGLLSSGDTQSARDQLSEAYLPSVNALRPYIYWAFSLSFRVERQIAAALQNAFFALEHAEATAFDKADRDLLWTHLRMVWLLASRSDRTRFEKRLFERLQKSDAARFTSWFPRDRGAAEADGG